MCQGKREYKHTRLTVNDILRLSKERRLVTESNLVQLNRNKKSTNMEKMFHRTNALADSKSSRSSLRRQKKVLVAFSQATNSVATERCTL
jgi:hypothetical protein